jgi:PBP1b-binding outer membrane lipoprotein LpoB
MQMNKFWLILTFSILFVTSCSNTSHDERDKVVFKSKIDIAVGDFFRDSDFEVIDLGFVNTSSMTHYFFTELYTETPSVITAKSVHEFKNKKMIVPIKRGAYLSTNHFIEK